MNGHEDYCDCPACLITRDGIRFADDTEQGRLVSALEDLSAKLTAAAADLRRTAAGFGPGSVGPLILGSEADRLAGQAKTVRRMADAVAKQ